MTALLHVAVIRDCPTGEARFFTAGTAEALHRQIARYCIDNWDDDGPDDGYDGLSDVEIADRYFEFRRIYDPAALMIRGTSVYADEVPEVADADCPS
ncbi:MAG: hypothetical protein PHZ23_15525 [Acidiphilium sp.]|nr:hypothetical protein [Acidiphilium sp.]